MKKMEGLLMDLDDESSPCDDNHQENPYVAMLIVD